MDKLLLWTTRVFNRFRIYPCKPWPGDIAGLLTTARLRLRHNNVNLLMILIPALHRHHYYKQRQVQRAMLLLYDWIHMFAVFYNCLGSPCLVIVFMFSTIYKYIPRFDYITFSPGYGTQKIMEHKRASSLMPITLTLQIKSLLQNKVVFSHEYIFVECSLLSRVITCLKTICFESVLFYIISQ